MIKSRMYAVVAILGLVALLAGACAPTAPTTPTTPTTPITPTTPTTPTQTTTGALEVYVTDAPPREEVTSIMVTISEVQVHKASAEQEQEQQQTNTGNQTQEQEQEQTQQDGGEWISIAISDDANTFDLLEIRGIEQYLGASEIEAAKYTQVRLVVETVQVEFDDNGNFKDARIPSKELKIVHPFNIIDGETTALVLDFDADKMVTVTGSGDIIVKPVVKLTVKQEKSSGQKDKEDEETLEDTKWALESYGESGNLTGILENSEITAEFVSAEGTIKGSAGCNSYFGNYEQEGGQLSIPGPIGATAMYCMEPEGVMDQEQEYLTLLQLAESYVIDGDELQINCGSQVLIFNID
ncbi:DUF4382 domain-containing protein [Chloroflexota bacterium]